MDKKRLSVNEERATERIRQEKETFNQRKVQDNQWFLLKLVMGFFAVLLLATILVISTYILIRNNQFPHSVVISAGAALFIDILALVISVWKIVLNPNSMTKLEPITGQEDVY